jgi:hypothetical protein
VIPSPLPDCAAQSGIPTRRCEVVAAAVLRAARTSARLTETGLAIACEADEATIRAWEDGSQPLTTVPTPQLEQLKHALANAGASPQIIADLDAGAWCDLVMLATARSEDCTGLLADPISVEATFRELLAWALHGRIPARYARCVLPGALITDQSLAERAVAVLNSIRPDLLPC